MTNDEKLSDLRMEYGSVAIDVWLTLLDLIYGGKGYYIEYGDEKTKNRLIWKILGIVRGKYPPTPETVSKIIEGLVACELFSGDLYQSGILSSKRIQKQFYQATVERKTVSVNHDYWLLDLEEMEKLSSRSNILKSFDNQPNLTPNQPINEENQPILKQSKVKESKVKKSKEYMSEAKATDSTNFINLPLNDKSEFAVTETMIAEWSELYPAVDIKQELRKMKGWLDSNPTRRKTKSGIKRFITNWLAKSQDSGGSKNTEKSTPDYNYGTKGVDYL